MHTETYFKFTAANGACAHGTGRWTRRRWRTVTGELVPCRNGIHYLDADHLLTWLNAELWTFEDGTPDERLKDVDKYVTRKGRVLERIESWNERTARLFAADCAEQVMPIFETSRPGDDRPRKAIETARLYANGEIDDAAWAAAGAAARAAAWDAAGAAARAPAVGAAAGARDAAGAAARVAAEARDAAWAAVGAAAGARDAAGAAARDAADAWDAAGAAAWAAARDAAWAWQHDHLLDLLGMQRAGLGGQ